MGPQPPPLQSGTWVWTQPDPAAPRPPRSTAPGQAEPQNLRLLSGPVAEAPWSVVVRWKPISFRSPCSPGLPRWGVTGGCLASPSAAGSWRATWGHGGVDAEGRLAEILVLQAVLRADPPPREVGQEPGRTRHWSRRGAGGAGEHFPLK